MSPANPPMEHPPISLRALHILVHNLTPQQIEAIPTDKLPADIPAGFVEKAPVAVHGALEKLLFRASHDQIIFRQQLHAQYGDAVVEIIDRVRHIGNHQAFAALKHHVDRLHGLYKDWRVDRIKLNRILPALSEAGDMLREALALQGRMDHDLARLRHCIRHQDDSGAELIEDTLVKLEQQRTRLQLLLSNYYRLQSVFLGQEMIAHQQQIQNLRDQVAGLDSAILEKREQLDSLKAPRWARSAEVTREREQLQEEISHLVEERHNKNWLLQEKDLTRWLDGVVDASIYIDGDMNLRNARLTLFMLLNTFCVAQEESAAKIAANPFLPIDPKLAIQHTLMSERFVLDYFARKRKHAAQWLGQAAHTRIQSLNKLEKNLLRELKRSTRRLKS